MQSSVAPLTQSFEESIPLRPNEWINQQARKQLKDFRSSPPVPCLWITAHIADPIPRSKGAALEKLSIDLGHLGTADLISNAYREFLQKQLIRLNNKLLRYKSTGLCFHFRGTLERNSSDPVGRNLHYHFALWAPKHLFKSDPCLMQSTKDTLIVNWHRHVNDQATERYKPIHIDIINTKEDAARIASYEAKSNPMTQAYELFDDWSLAGCQPIPH
jgi:hypothetical protein